MTRRFRLRPLTPVHIGGKERLAPEDYVLDGDVLVRLKVSSILSALSPELRRSFEREIDAGRLRPAQEIVGNFWRRLPPSERPKFEQYRTRVGEGAREELRQLVARPERSGEVAALPRNPYTGDVVIPGSAIKGAIRTALVSMRVNGEAKEAFERAASNQPNKRARVLEETAFGYRSSATESDPLRLLKVSDASWPAAAVRVDRATLHKLGNGGRENVPIYLERLECRADGVSPPECEVTISLREEAALTPAERCLFRVLFDWDKLFLACGAFFVGRLQAEGHRFEEVRRFAGEWWPSQQEVNTGLLLRVGRYCHFDSLSVDGFREGWNAQRREPIREIGSTRTLCETAGGKRLPFGWVLLEPV
ncbi:MAG TPA: type III-A CRISPR-associated RAMP protein Csm5 [Bryobacteraceae bacterium]|nr:type III-A CRISPR-associated RAMP protein Csm5 [Bryobacteraceae bacterium]